MQPNSDQQRGLQVPSSRGHISPQNGRQQAADLMRQQIDQIYEDPQPNEQTAAHVQADDTSAQPHTNPYTQTHNNQADVTAEEQDTAIQEHWQKYHSAWQQYYQMYYERYYQAAVQKQLSDHATKTAETFPKTAEKPAEFTTEQAVGELRSELLEKVRAQTKKIKSNRHFMPAVVACMVALIFGFLQFNQIIFANLYAFTTPASLDVVSTLPNTSTDVDVGPDPILNIPKIGIQAPVVYGLTTLEESAVEAKLQDGVVHYPVPGANALPGQIGNTVILGHSANDVFAAGNFKFVFLRLDQLQKDDRFYLNYQGKRYTYVVTDKQVITPNQVSKLVIDNGKPMATLVTCVPVGTSQNRLLVIAEQVAPDPSTATAQDTTASNNAGRQEIGGGTKTVFERLFSGN